MQRYHPSFAHRSLKSFCNSSKPSMSAQVSEDSAPAADWTRVSFEFIHAYLLTFYSRCLPRGRMLPRKRGKGKPSIESSCWTFSRHGIGQESTDGRNPGDVHVSPKTKGEGFQHWVLEDESGESRWLRYSEGDWHPCSSDYVLLPSDGTRPPRWITIKSMKKRWRMDSKPLRSDTTQA